MSRLAGRHAVVTGGGSGIGAAIARVLTAEGALVSVVGRRQAPLDALTSEIGSFGAVADVTDRDQVDAAFAAARAAHGPISILINNAGAAASGPFAKQSAEGWRNAMAVNLDALFHCTQSALADLLAADAGRVVMIASTAGLKGYGYVAPYVAAKHGAIGLTRALAIEYATTGLTVNAVCPGFTDTDLVAEAVSTIREKTGRDAATVRKDLAQFNPQKRLIDPAEVASAVLWLCQPENQSITGQALAVAGGEVM
ncbi:SDR family NAD(P)-dependent oxidoreductase [Sphingobium boeckii]|uniref:NAD(P)-dependent dehydrogenase (Short-subunit alcohol dehydrogenase family) n=1 Tax=Sphingobium boeckii TaxID=1082345 RepID=A0A7W9AJM5_9SPHN|nr:SDR family NAD(P)-dependent oxidoreductase [Sphingobium boeckii]MBB5686890.1 NAD(P)-dependent dehydrogenase (short-subunit alcohol dehydrogenase family) [Sphingobium boeckii]